MDKVDYKILNKNDQQMQNILRNAYNIVLFIYNRYFTYFEAVNLVKRLTVQKMYSKA